MTGTTGRPGPATNGSRPGTTEVAIDVPAVRTAGRRGKLRHLPRLARRLHAEHTDPMQRSLLATWTAFGITFGTARLITHGIRDGWLPWGNISAGGKHFHHFNLGIGLLAGVGLIAVRGDDAHVCHPRTAAAYGVGAALVADEFALLLDLQDVYWAEEGRVSVDVSLGVLAVLGIYLSAKPFWHALGRATQHHLRSA